jgi:hypothetical protein
MAGRHRADDIGDRKRRLVVSVARESGDETIVPVFGMRRLDGFPEKRKRIGWWTFFAPSSTWRLTGKRESSWRVQNIAFQLKKFHLGHKNVLHFVLRLTVMQGALCK